MTASRPRRFRRPDGTTRPPRDVIDDYCTRCRMIMNHGIVGMVGDEVAKVRCNTCQFEHAYKHGRLPKKRRGETDRLFAEVLRGIRGDPDPEAEESEAAGGEPGTDDASGEEVEKPSVAGRTRVARGRARGAAGHLKAAAKQGRSVGRHTRAAKADRGADEGGEAEDADRDEDAGTDGDAAMRREPEEALPRDEETPAGPDGDPERPEDPEPSHGVRRKLFTIRRHSGGKPPVAGVTTDGSAERRAAQAQGHGGGRQGQQGGFGGRGGHGGHGGAGGHGGQGGHGGGRHGQGGGGRQDQQGRWPRRHRRRG